MIPSRFRRDILAGLVGGVVAAGVLVPVGWLMVASERGKARAAEVEAEYERTRAELVIQESGAARAAWMKLMADRRERDMQLLRDQVAVPLPPRIGMD